MEEQQMLKAASRTVSTCDLSFFSDRSRQNEKEKTAKRGCLDGNPGRGMLLYMHDVFFFFLSPCHIGVKCFGEGDNLVYD